MPHWPDARTHRADSDNNNYYHGLVYLPIRNYRLQNGYSSSRRIHFQRGSWPRVLRFYRRRNKPLVQPVGGNQGLPAERNTTLFLTKKGGYLEEILTR